jgi:hypothetical protein
MMFRFLWCRFPPQVTEGVLNHISGSRAGIAGVYQRHDWAGAKRAALDAWAADVLTVVNGRTATAKVVTVGAGELRPNCTR